MKKLKILFWGTLVFVIISIMVWKFFLYFMRESFGPRCEFKSTWRIQGYEIVEKQCIGFAGPPYYPLYLYKNKNKNQIDYVNYKDDSCTVKFIEKNEDTLYFNLCTKILIRKAK